MNPQLPSSLTAMAPEPRHSNPWVELESLPVERRLTHYVSAGVHKELEKLLDLAPFVPALGAALSAVHHELDGTVRWHAIDRCVLMANSGEHWVEASANFARCAALLQPYPIGHVHLSHGAAAQSLLDTQWHRSASAHVVEALLRECLADGSVDVTQRLPKSGTPMSELLPLAASFVDGNVLAARAIVDHIMTLDAPEAHLLAPLQGTDFTDILEYARSFRSAGCEAAASVLAEALMTLRLSAPAKVEDAKLVGNSEEKSAPARRRPRL